jgi:hypothetical protein
MTDQGWIGHTKGSSSRMHDVFQAGFFNETLDICNLGRDRRGRGSNLCAQACQSASVGQGDAVMQLCTWSCEETVGKCSAG